MDFNFTELLTMPNMLFGLLTGVVSSFIFLLILSLLKPRIGVSNEVAQNINNINDENGSSLFIFKIINKSPFFKVYDITLKVYSKKIVPSPNGEDEETSEIELRMGYQRILHRFNVRHYFQDSINGKKRLKTRTNYAAQFSTFTDINEILLQGKFIEIEVYAKHALTGFSKIFTTEYKHPNNIVKGSFCSGNSFKIC